MDLATHPPATGGQPVALGSGQILAGRYRVVAFLGGGSVGEVYEAEDLELGVPIALKILHPGADDEQVLQRFKQEIQLARRVTHPNVCRTYDLAYHGDAAGPRVFLTMELLRGETLADRLSRQGRMTAAEALPIVRQVAGALGAAHGSGVVHRDLKSANIFLESGGRALVTDFGLAWSRDAAGPAAPGELTGSPAYMSPEQVRGEMATPESDIYALGVVLYEMVTGELPFVGPTAFSTAVKRLHEPPPPPSSKLPVLEPAWNAAILRCLEREPSGRFATTEEMANALSRPASPVPPPPPRPSPSRALRAGLAAGLAFAAAGLLAIFLLRNQGTAPVLQGDVVGAIRPPELAVEIVRQRNLLSEALSGARERGDTATEVKTQEKLARLAKLQGDLPSARRGFQRTVELLRGTGDRRVLAAALQNVATAAFELGDPDGARGPQQEALALASRAGDRSGIAQALHGLGNLDRLTGKLAAAERKYEQAFTLYGDLQQPRGQAILLQEIGRLYTLRRQPVRGLETLGQALTLCGRPCPIEAAVLNDIGSSFWFAQDPSAAFTFHERALALSRERHSENDEARALIGIGYALVDLGRPRDANDPLAAAFAIFHRLGNRNRETAALSGMARALAASGDYEGALRKFQAARSVRLEIGERLIANESLLEIAELSLAYGHRAEGAAAAGEAVRVFRELGLPEGEAKASAVLARCLNF